MPPKNTKVLSNSNKDVISKESAILKAEEFILKNGYTNQAVTHNDEIKAESFEPWPTREERLKHRFDTLKPKAVSAKFDKNKWIVGFEYTNKIKQEYPEIKDNKTGRAVAMDAAGSVLSMQHKEIFLDWLLNDEITIQGKLLAAKGGWFVNNVFLPDTQQKSTKQLEKYLNKTVEITGVVIKNTKSDTFDLKTGAYSQTHAGERLEMIKINSIKLLAAENPL